MKSFSSSGPASPAAIRRPLKELSKRAWRCCKCHAVIVVPAGLPCTLMTATVSAFPAWGNPTQMPCSSVPTHCENISLASLRSQIAFFLESDTSPHVLPFSSSQEPKGRPPVQAM
ncbi:hypothetical protein G5714_007640 [Onychostoma macrolepis]|uniref:Uncharacterized protein n=1 Tax=Onychostoma macrolepis TaxID=369639 RepID=A0A7J6CTE0_9TELE|nr:hypothetical protein G5714_007640 [Onychostoma macrolepis]